VLFAVAELLVSSTCRSVAKVGVTRCGIGWCHPSYFTPKPITFLVIVLKSDAFENEMK